MSCW
jgi:hypothetical protein